MTLWNYFWTGEAVAPGNFMLESSSVNDEGMLVEPRRIAKTIIQTTPGQEEAYARLICMAVNNHERLVSVLQLVLEDYKRDAWRHPEDARITVIKETLSLVEKGFI